MLIDFVQFTIGDVPLMEREIIGNIQRRPGARDVWEVGRGYIINQVTLKGRTTNNNMTLGMGVG